jgi:hypothetical protein
VNRALSADQREQQAARLEQITRRRRLIVKECWSRNICHCQSG